MTPNFLETFQVEAEELIEEIERCALLLEAGASGAEANDLVNRIFRGFHNIKGSCAMFRMTALMNFTHKVETLLDLVREGQVAVSTELAATILESADHVKALLEGNLPNEASARLEQKIERMSAAHRS